ncbi:hypothetical protein Ahy_A09g043324 [Arachis hypogaea]|uniref:Uncharacterized protein n=1 Tax=Arachis hypogaea TaxID=3818 RepID=A0A445BI09_ARAHY|nr:hypothetical protein Ahy_A09g043324 [Arachis hypogaea]
MTLCFLALYNTINEMAFDIFKDYAVKCLPYLKKLVRDSGCGSRFVFYSVILALPASSSRPSCNCIQRHI